MQNPVPQILLALLLAHLIADFPLQREIDIKRKQQLKLRAFLTHALLHGGLSYLLCGIWSLWQIPVVIAVTHFLIDLFKELLTHLSYPANSKPRCTFVSKLGLFEIDQLLHMTVLAAIGQWIFNHKIAALITPTYWETAITTGQVSRIFALFSGTIFTVWTGGYVVGIIVKPYQDHLTKEPLGLPQAGRLIGQLERLLVLTFVLTGQLSAVGFLVTAKSILRFSEVKNTQDRMQVEYVLIGTLMSFAWAILFGYATRYLLGIL